MAKRRCECEPYCPNPAVVAIDFKMPDGSFGYKTKRICVYKAKELLEKIAQNPVAAGAR